MKNILIILLLVLPVLSHASSAVAVWNKTANTPVYVVGGSSVKPGSRSWYHLGVSGKSNDHKDIMVIRVGKDEFTLEDQDIPCEGGDWNWQIKVYHGKKDVGILCATMYGRFDDTHAAYETHSLVVISDLDVKKGLTLLRYYSTGQTGSDHEDLSGFLKMDPKKVV